MRRVPLLSVLIMFVVTLLSIPTIATGQTSVRTLNPLIVRIELSDIEPPPPDVDAQVDWSAGGGPSGYADTPSNSPQWTYLPVDGLADIEIDEGAVLAACGYPLHSGPNAHLTLPDGHQQVLIGSEGAGCWYYVVPSYYGMELGQYTLILEHPRGTLSHSWTIDYTPKPYLTKIKVNSVLKHLLMGFKPLQTVNLHFYGFFEAGSNLSSHIASRSIQLDSSGAALIDIVTSRSAAFGTSQIRLVVNDQYGTTLSDSPFSSDNCGGVAPPSRLSLGDQARVMSGSSNLINDGPSRPSLHPETRTLGKIPAGGTVTIIGGPECTDNILWWQVGYQGILGWTGEGENSTYWLEPVR